MTYSSSLALGRHSRRHQNAVSFRAQAISLGPVSNSVVLVILSCILGLLYLTQVTKTNAHGYKINELTQKQTRLKTERDELEVASARLQALDRVKNSTPAQALVAVSPAATIQN
jgi:hypothetical protein